MQIGMPQLTPSKEGLKYFLLNPNVETRNPDLKGNTSAPLLKGLTVAFLLNPNVETRNPKLTRRGGQEFEFSKF